MRARILLLVLLLISRSSALLAQDGALDPTFDPGEGAGAVVLVILPAESDKSYVGGWFGTFGGSGPNCFVRLNNDGSLDPGFDIGTGPNSFVSASALQPDEKIIIAGDFTTIDGVAYSHIARLNSDGSIDPGFNGSVSGVVESCHVQPDGKIFLAGWFGGPSFNYITRLNADGSVDTSFDPGTGPNDAVLDAELQPDGKLIISGLFSSFNGTPVGNIARLNADGSLDTGFGAGTGADANVQDLTLQPDGKVIIAGGFAAYDGTALNGFARLNADGTLDNDFHPVIEVYAVYCAVVQPDDKIIIGGTFTEYDGTPRNRIARLNSDGTLDLSFYPGSGANDGVEAVALQPGGKVLIGGEFTSYDGFGRNRIARLLNDFPSAVPMTHAPGLDVFHGPSHGAYVLTSRLAGPAIITVTDMAGRVVLRDQGDLSQGRTLELGEMPSGIYQVTVHGRDATRTARLFKQ